MEEHSRQSFWEALQGAVWRQLEAERPVLLMQRCSQHLDWQERLHLWMGVPAPALPAEELPHLWLLSVLQDLTLASRLSLAW